MSQYASKTGSMRSWWQGRKPEAVQKRRFRPLLEQLEGRDVPSGAAPTANSISGLTTLHGHNLIGIDLIGNCSDPESDPLSISIVAQPSHGMVGLNNGVATYYPMGNYVGADSFSFKANDGTSDSNVASVSLTVTNNAPVASNAGPLSVVHNHTLSNVPVSATDADGDSLTISIVDQPAHGTLVLNFMTNSYQYTPNATYYGPDSFTFRANDGAANSNLATVTIDVTDSAPVAVQDDVDTATDDFDRTGEVSNNVVDNDSDPDAGDSVIVTKVNGLDIYAGTGNCVTGTYGTLQVYPDGSSTYRLIDDDPDLVALTGDDPVYDDFTYTIADQCAVTAQATEEFRLDPTRTRMIVTVASPNTNQATGNFLFQANAMIRVEIDSRRPSQQVIIMLDGLSTANGARIMQYSTSTDGSNLTTAPVSTGNSGQKVVYVPVAANNITGVGHSLRVGRPVMVNNATALDVSRAPFASGPSRLFDIAAQ